ncbi:MAG: flagellar hook-associated protein FlgL, partial [Caldimonas sp.]
MRIATANAFETGIDTLGRRQSEISSLQEQLSSGKRVARASDDPAAAARAERALAGIGRAETSQRAVEASRVAMTQTESTLGDASGLLQRARELVVSAGNATYGDSERATIGRELRSIREQLLSVANASDGAGIYLFGGQGATQQPFVDAAGGVQFAAAPGQSLTESPTGLPLTTDGQAAWLSARTGNGVFVTSASAGVRDATIDNGRVADPSALTGASYDLQFGVVGGVTTYAVMKDGLATAVTAAPYVSGQAITIDGMTVSVSG